MHRDLNDRYKSNKSKVFYSGGGMYPEHNQLDPDNPDCREESAYPANQILSMDGKNF